MSAQKTMLELSLEIKKLQNALTNTRLSDTREWYNLKEDNKKLREAWEKIHIAIGEGDPVNIANVCAEYVIPLLKEK